MSMLPMPKTILPIGAGVFRAEDEDNLRFARVEGDHAAVCAVSGPVKLFDLAGRGVHQLNRFAGKV